MARVVVIFAILSLIAGAMYWLARHPAAGTHDEPAAATLPVASTATANTTTAPDTSTSGTTAASTPPYAGSHAAEAAPTTVPPEPSASSAETAPSDAASPVTLNASGAEANMLGQTTTQSSTSAQTGLVVETVEPASGNAIALKGRADPGATVKVSVDGKASGEVVVGGSGSWSVSVDKGHSAAEPQIALELVGSDGKLLDKTNFVFRNVSAPPLSPQDRSLIGERTTTSKPAAVHKPRSTHSMRTAFRVRHGESLWRIAKRRLGDGDKWRVLYEANKDVIGDDPDFVRAGTRLVIPG